MKGLLAPHTGFPAQDAVSTVSDGDSRDKKVAPLYDLEEPIFFMKPDTALLQGGDPFSCRFLGGGALRSGGGGEDRPAGEKHRGTFRASLL